MKFLKFTYSKYNSYDFNSFYNSVFNFYLAILDYLFSLSVIDSFSNDYSLLYFLLLIYIAFTTI